MNLRGDQQKYLQNSLWFYSFLQNIKHLASYTYLAIATVVLCQIC